jgi:hypothetical protein
MPESFTLHFLYKDIPQEIECTLRVSAYTYQFLCLAGDSQMIIEKDDEGNLRAMESDPFSARIHKPDAGLIKAMLAEMERVLQ